jgi:predicted HAD superfamily hydrolase
MFWQWRDYWIIQRSGLFDPGYYLLAYPDCRLADIDPIKHFILYGWREGRNPSAGFDTTYYLKANPDVAQTGTNPLIHYIKFGRKEGRAPHQNWSKRSETGSQHGSVLQWLRYSVVQIGKKIYWFIPIKYRKNLLERVYRRLGFLFKGMHHYEIWRNTGVGSTSPTVCRNNLIDLSQVKPAQRVEGRIAISLHIHYHDLVKEFAGYLGNMPFPYDLFVSVTSDEGLRACQQAFSNLPVCRNVQITKVINRGRDIAPMFCTFGDVLKDYDFIAHLHSKKSLYNMGASVGWREYLCTSLFGTEDRIRRIFTLLQGDQVYGLVYPQMYLFVPSWANTWLANKALGEQWCARLGITDVPRGYFDFPVSSMFWARADALAPLFNAGIQLEDFPVEAGQTDGTTSHCLERMFGLSAVKQEKPLGILRDDAHPSWSAWRFDQYTDRAYDALLKSFHHPSVKLIAFDVFDTLLTRPLLDPESIKQMVARQLPEEDGRLYREYRPIGEQQARHEKGADVGLEEIYARLGRLTGLSRERLTEIRQMEENLEINSLEPRPGAHALFSDAVATGKPVVIISDMFLPRQIVEQILRKHGFTGWDELFISNQVGLRKDQGKLYDFVLDRYSLKPADFLMVGDNERSDIQIPCDMGARFLHLLKPVELARGLPRSSGLIAGHERLKDLDADATLGLVVRKNFAPIHFQNFDPDSLVQVSPYSLGYSLVGPVLVSFAQWALEQARQDGMDRLYFLAREGKLIKQIFDNWCAGEENVPRTDYLVASRRAAGVAAISTLDDIIDISRVHYFPNPVEEFLYTRYGLRLSEDRWRQIARSSGWEPGAEVAVRDGRSEHLIPLLKALQDDIFANVEQERKAFLDYLAEKGVNAEGRQAVVDIGFAGSVQGYLNKIQTGKVHGYYLMTIAHATQISSTYDVILRGCFLENADPHSAEAMIYRNSFFLEKLFSSDDPQLEHFEKDADGKVKGCFHALTPEEEACAEYRRDFRAGAQDYVEDARRIRTSLLPDFRPSCLTARMLMEAFLGEFSIKESEFLSKIVLDDYYCGRGLVS